MLLPHAPTSVIAARWHISTHLREAGIVTPAIGDATLVVSELLTNAILHARPLPGARVLVAWALRERSLEVAVSDGGSMTRPRNARPSLSSIGGRGLAIVEHLSCRWGVLPNDFGLTVWAVLPAPGDDRPAAPHRPGGSAGAACSAGHNRAPPASQVRRVLPSLWSAASWTGKVRHVELRVSSRSQGDHTIVTLAGEIDLYTAPRLQTELVAAMRSADSALVVVDMSGVEFCDSTGMNVLLAAHRQACEQGGDLALAAPRAPVRKILEVTGLASVFTVHDDLATLTGQ